ncbi:methyl esterase 17 [Striga asiatica]|uniref:Methyl esterase 17 n=1 Tax=Striga asiatica TaxID=4170 RepID=A0A5A7PH41_STRAF|nr:methyl esterase 17 [Striga asiatica]
MEREVLKKSAAHFVFVHGIGGGAWCWYKIKCLMENSGYRYNNPLIHFLSSLPHNHQVILVGHSAGGLSLTQAIHKFGPNKIKLAVFVAATMFKSGVVYRN